MNFMTPAPASHSQLNNFYGYYNKELFRMTPGPGSLSVRIQDQDVMWNRDSLSLSLFCPFSAHQNKGRRDPIMKCEPLSFISRYGSL